MLSVQCGWVLGCLLVAMLHRAHSTTTVPTSTPPNPPQHHSADRTADTDPGVTCYTCVNVSDNLVCNRFAIDRPCPRGEDFCYTLHIMDSKGQSVVVNKKCADHNECTPQRVGCLDIDTQKVCVACCDEMYCNISVPTNHSTAIYTDTRTREKHQTTANETTDHSGGRSGYASSVVSILLIQLIGSCI